MGTLYEWTLRLRIRYYDRKWHRLQSQIVAKIGINCGDLSNQRDFCNGMEALLRNRLGQLQRKRRAQPTNNETSVQ
jgi:hypothetical protein